MYKIHIIEDNKTYSSIVTKKLRKEGFDVSQAFSTNEEIPDADVYLIDLHLNEMSFDLIKRIKYRKIIVMS
ncbi:MAG: response regulator transcription factor [Arcobacter sp.]|nr:response regulator transcription factor [Arcobacter sp.]